MKTLVPRLRAGFTLLEIMVSTAIMVVIVLVVVTIAADTFRVYDRAVADLSTQSEARGVLDAMENDFSTAVLHSDGRCWMEVVVPGSASVPGAPGLVGNLQATDHPIVMLFASPLDRPRWTPGAGRVALKGGVCAVAYRIGQRSPFDAPGEKIQQVYGVYRTIIDAENTFNEAVTLIRNSTTADPKTPWDYWSASRRFANYSRVPTPSWENRVLIDANVSSATPCWTMDENNFIGSNVVAMNLVFWGASSLPATASSPALQDPLGRQSKVLRPVTPVGRGDDKSALAPALGGYSGVFKTGTSAADVALRFAASGAPNVPQVTPSGAGSNVQPFDYYGTRLRVFADRMYPDALPLQQTSPNWLPYLPYSLRAVEVSVVVLTPEGSKELRGLQSLNDNQKIPDNDFKRIVFQHGRTYTRYIRVLGNGG